LWQALAQRGFEALYRAVQLGSAGANQCPLEAILEYDLDALRAVRELVVKEMGMPVSDSMYGTASTLSMESSILQSSFDGHIKFLDHRSWRFSYQFLKD
jgi:hypothetical protein